MEKEKKDKTLFYMLETINMLCENQKTLLKRINKIEEALDVIALQFFNPDDEEEKKIIN